MRGQQTLIWPRATTWRRTPAADERAMQRAWCLGLRLLLLLLMMMMLWLLRLRQHGRSVWSGCRLACEADESEMAA